MIRTPKRNGRRWQETCRVETGGGTGGVDLPDTTLAFISCLWVQGTETPLRMAQANRRLVERMLRTLTHPASRTAEPDQLSRVLQIFKNIERPYPAFGYLT